MAEQTSQEERSRLRRKMCAAAAAASVLGLAAVVASYDLGRFGGLVQLYGSTNAEYAPASPIMYSRAVAQHRVLARMCFGDDCAEVPPAFAKALIRTERGAYANAFNAGEASERREMSVAKPHQVGDVIAGLRPMRVATLQDQVGEHERMVAALPPKPVWHSQWQKLFGPKKSPGKW